jgi:hypothetical protein
MTAPKASRRASGMTIATTANTAAIISNMTLTTLPQSLIEVLARGVIFFCGLWKR